MVHHAKNCQQHEHRNEHLNEVAYMQCYASMNSVHTAECEDYDVPVKCQNFLDSNEISYN